MLLDKCKKRSFLKLNVPIDIKKLIADFNEIGKGEWSSSYWGDVHCSIGMLLLKGGIEGGPQDFYSGTVEVKPILNKLQYIKYLLSDRGPFGYVQYAFLFKTEPEGVTLKHRDLMDCWKDMYRIHIPIITNQGAFLIANSHSQHFKVGEAWTFDNLGDHGVVNGPEERTHLIFDVPNSPKIDGLITNSSFHKGRIIDENNRKIALDNNKIASYRGEKEMSNAIKILRSRGVSDKDIAKFFNAQNIPTKEYPPMPWDEKMIERTNEA